MHYNMFIFKSYTSRHHYVILRRVYYQHNVRSIVPAGNIFARSGGHHRASRWASAVKRFIGSTIGFHNHGEGPY